nr:hypothetical protein [Tanacetum cinerariifolium]
KYKTARELWAAILKTFGGNEATKKRKKNLLKQQYGNFKAEGSESLEQTFNRLQVIVRQLQFMDVEVEQDDLNQKFLTSLAPEWLMHTIVWRNKSDLDTISLDDLYNHLKHSSGNEDRNTTCVSTASTIFPIAGASIASISQDTACAYIASQSSSSQINFEDINQINEDDMEEMDIKWSMALLMQSSWQWLYISSASGNQLHWQWERWHVVEMVVWCGGCGRWPEVNRRLRLAAGKREKKMGARFITYVLWHLKQDELHPKLHHLDLTFLKREGRLRGRSILVLEDHRSILRVTTPYNSINIRQDNSFRMNVRETMMKMYREIVENKKSKKKGHLGLKTMLLRALYTDLLVTDHMVLQNFPTANRKFPTASRKFPTGLLTASKDLDNLIESQRPEKNKEGLGYTVVPPPTTQLYLSSKKDLS